MLLSMLFDSSRDRPEAQMDFEALVVAALVLASRHGGVHGVRFSEFLGVMLYELGVVEEREGFQLPDGVANFEASKLTVPFLSPPNVAWPEWFLADWENTSVNFANLSLLAGDDDIGRADFGLSSGGISGECSREFELSTIEDVVCRIPDESLVHLVVTEKTTGLISETVTANSGAGEGFASTAIYHISKGSIMKLVGTSGPSGSSDDVDRHKLAIVIELVTSSWRSLLKERLPAVVSRWL